MASALRTLVVRAIDLNSLNGGSGDSRVGSARNGAKSSGTLSTDNGNKSSSLSSLGSTFIPVVVYTAVCLLIFMFLRPRCNRVYAPRTFAGLRSPHRPTPALPTGWFNWIKPFFQTPDTFALHHGSLDGFFFLRYLKVLRNIFLVGICISWPILFPVHATGGNGLTQLDLLTIGNIKNPKRMFAHVVVAWIFFGFVLFTVTRECVFYINIRQAYLSSPNYANRISSRTLLLTCVPDRYLDEARLRKLYGDSVKHVWIPRTAKILVKLVQEREQTAMRLEKAEIELIRKAGKARRKAMRAMAKKASTSEPWPVDGTISSRGSDSFQRDGMERGSDHSAAMEERLKMENTTRVSQVPSSPDIPMEEADDSEYVHPYGLDANLPDVRGSVAARWIPVSSRPHHRPLGNYGRRVDTIRWTRNKLGELNKDIWKLRRILRRGEGRTLPAAFIEFDTQEAAQAAHQIVAHHRPLQLAPRILGVRPNEIVWSSLRMRWGERIVRRFSIMGLVTFAVIFWSIPSAFIGVISNIKFLSAKVFFLKWIMLLPTPITGFLQGFVPAIALSFWMSLVPFMLRFCAVQAGVPSYILVELFTQNAYFAFQVVQVFLITTLTSAASAALMDILKDPMSVKDLLAQNLPKASNFYLSYILVQCLFVGSTRLLQVFELIRHHFFANIAQLPRAQFKIWYNLRPPRYGGVYPVFTNMAVIAFSYTCIAPLILLFAAAGLSFMRLIYRYNILYVLDSEMDSKGLFYPRGLLHLIVGLYMAEICMIGLFALKSAFGPMVLMLVFSVFTGLVHMTISEAIAPLLNNLPQTLSLEEQLQEEEKHAAESAAAAAVEAGEVGGAANSYYDTQQTFGEEEEEEEYGNYQEDEDEHDGPTGDRALEGAGGMATVLGDAIKEKTWAKLKAELEDSSITKLLKKWNVLGTQATGSPNFLQRFINPDIYEDFVALSKLIPAVDFVDDEDSDNSTQATYWPPELWQPKPTLWIPRDEARVSRQEVAHTKKVTPITDHGVEMTDKGRVTVNLEQAPFPRRRLLH